MIFKSFELDKSNLTKFKLFVIYGENEGLKQEIINKIKGNKTGKEIKYEETQILKNKSEFNNEIKNKSLFEENRIFLLERCSDKISELIIEICENIKDDSVIINCGILEKKSKFRNYLEKSNNAVIIPTYKDNSQSLVNIAKKYFDERKISISYETLNLLANRSNGDRGYLNQELEKISNYTSNGKVISLREINALTNLSENYTAAELVDASLSGNIKKTREILSENIYSHEDTFLILRVFLQKAKKILNLLENINNEKDIEKVISEYKPPIFWKDKPIIKKQLKVWSFKGIKSLIYKLNDIEVKIKKNNSISLILIKNFIYEILDTKTSNQSLSSQ
tara:strand:- start:2046 stop:3056 length:1011 start_codon:yes stop_codon:yes gene_type:complete